MRRGTRGAPGRTLEEIAEAFAWFGMVPKACSPAELATLTSPGRRPGADHPLHGLQAAGAGTTPPAIAG